MKKLSEFRSTPVASFSAHSVKFYLKVVTDHRPADIPSFVALHRSELGKRGEEAGLLLNTPTAKQPGWSGET